MNKIDPRIQIFTRLYDQCTRLGFPFPYDYKALLKRPQEINTRACDFWLCYNAAKANRKIKDKENNKEKGFDIKDTKAFKYAIKVKHGPKKGKKKRKKNLWGFHGGRPIIYVGHMWRG
jgi:hypothetical protein